MSAVGYILINMDQKELIKKLEQMKKELAHKQRRLERAKRAAVAKAHVKQKLKELNGHMSLADKQSAPEKSLPVKVKVEDTLNETVSVQQNCLGSVSTNKSDASLVTRGNQKSLFDVVCTDIASQSASSEPLKLSPEAVAQEQCSATTHMGLSGEIQQQPLAVENHFHDVLGVGVIKPSLNLDCINVRHKNESENAACAGSVEPPDSLGITPSFSRFQSFTEDIRPDTNLETNSSKTWGRQNILPENVTDIMDSMVVTPSFRSTSRESVSHAGTYCVVSFKDSTESSLDTLMQHTVLPKYLSEESFSLDVPTSSYSSEQVFDVSDEKPLSEWTTEGEEITSIHKRHDEVVNDCNGSKTSAEDSNYVACGDACITKTIESAGCPTETSLSECKHSDFFHNFKQGNSYLQLQAIGCDDDYKDVSPGLLNQEENTVLDYTELDVIPYSQIELTEDFLSQTSGSLQGDSLDKSCRRKSPRLSSVFNQNSSTAVDRALPMYQQRENIFRMARKYKKTKKCLLLSSLFQFLIDEAKRNAHFVEFSLPAYITSCSSPGPSKNGAGYDACMPKVTNSETFLDETNLKNAPSSSYQTGDVKVIPEKAVTDVAAAKTDAEKKNMPIGNINETSLESVSVCSAARTKLAYELTDSQIMVIPETEIDLNSQHTCSIFKPEAAHNIFQLPLSEIIISDQSKPQKGQCSASDNLDSEAGEDCAVSVIITAAAEPILGISSSVCQIVGPNSDVLNTNQNGASVKIQQIDLVNDSPAAKMKTKQTLYTQEIMPSDKQNFTNAYEVEMEPARLGLLQTNSSQIEIYDRVGLAGNLITETVLELQQTPSNKKFDSFAVHIESPILFDTQHMDRDRFITVDQSQSLVGCRTSSKYTSKNLQDSSTELNYQSCSLRSKDSTKPKKCKLIQYSGFAESECKAPVIQIVAGTATTKSEDVIFMLSMQTLVLNLWTLDKHGQWSTECSWYLPQGHRGEGMCRLETLTDHLAVMVWGVDFSSQSAFLSVYEYNWDTQHTQRFNLPLLSSVKPLRMFCLGLPSSPSTLVVCAVEKAYTKGKKYIVDRDQCCVSLEVSLEGVDKELRDLRLVESCEDAAVGLSLDHQLFVWNLSSGTLLVRLLVPEHLPTYSHLFSCFSVKGFLLMHVVEEVDGKLSLLAANPWTATVKVIRTFPIICSQDPACIPHIIIYEGSLMLTLRPEAVEICDASSGQSWASISEDLNISTVHIFRAKESLLLVTGQENGCLHVYSVNSLVC